MKMFGHKRSWNSGVSLCGRWGAVTLVAAFLSQSIHMVCAQAPAQAELSEKVQQLTEAVARTQAQLETSQRELNEMRKQLSELQHELAQSGAPAEEVTTAASSADPPSDPSQGSSEPTVAAIQDIREHQAVQDSEIATQAQTKVESESKYPVKVTGLLLMNGFVNTGAVDIAASPTIALGGPGSAGASVRQTILGFDAHGPHILGARSFADLRVDFYGSQAASATTTTYSGYYNANSAFLRLRTAHAGLYWEKTQVYFALDRPILSPDSPTSLTATAVPALAWSGNLWTWNPQAVVTQSLSHPGSAGVELQAALIDVGDAPLTPPVAPSATAMGVPPSSAEQSSKPGGEGRIAFAGAGRDDERNHFGVGGFFAPHASSLGRNFDSWAGTLDTRVALVARLEFTGSFYRGAALGGLGEGGYKDFAYSPNPNTGGYYFRPLDDVGGWAQLKEKANERLEFNAAYGMDNVFAGELRHYYIEGGPMIQNLARNHTITGNVIYSPSAYLLFSLEYRRLESTAVEGLPATGNIIGLGAGYKF
jgi:hypothetical protein